MFRFCTDNFTVLLSGSFTEQQKRNSVQHGIDLNDTGTAPALEAAALQML